MARVHTKISGFCFTVSKARIRSRSTPSHSNPSYNAIKANNRLEYYVNDCSSSFSSDTPRNSYDNSTKGDSKSGNRIMIVVDASQEAKGALQWALSQTVQKEDTVILLHIAKPSNSGSESESDKAKAYELLHSMRSICQTRKPGVQVELVALTGKEKGRIIVEQSKKQIASLLILGHRKQSTTWKFFTKWTRRNRSSRSMVDYCIKNADCMTIAVRRKSRKLGGYLITTKRHKNFWLLA